MALLSASIPKETLPSHASHASHARSTNHPPVLRMLMLCVLVVVPPHRHLGHALLRLRLLWDGQFATLQSTGAPAGPLLLDFASIRLVQILDEDLGGLSVRPRPARVVPASRAMCWDPHAAPRFSKSGPPTWPFETRRRQKRLTERRRAGHQQGAFLGLPIQRHNGRHAPCESFRILSNLRNPKSPVPV